MTSRGTWTDAELLQAFADSVAAARYWQGPDEVDRALLHASDDLAPVADMVAAPAWWMASIALDDQVTLTLQDSSPSFTGAAQKLKAWREATVADEQRSRMERPAALEGNWSGQWWSSPSLSGLISTSRELPGLALVEDSMGWSVAEVQSVSLASDVRVFEINSADDWSRLIDLYPLEVSASRRHDWWRAVGAREPLLMPDYQAVAEHWDAIHVSARGYLTTATRAVVTSRGCAVLAGWNPDQTWWLTDVVHAHGATRQMPVTVIT